MGYLDMPEKELVRRAVAGDQMAYRAIYQLTVRTCRLFVMKRMLASP